MCCFVALVNDALKSTELERALLLAKQICSTVLISGGLTMNAKLQALPLEERIRVVEDLWDSIVADQKALPLTAAQKAELDRRLEAYEIDMNKGRLASIAVADILRKI
jgi:putative addiction module component (TIGR02574 family)